MPGTAVHPPRERRETPVQCRRCRQPTHELDLVCEPCAIALATPACTDTYFSFDLDSQHVDVPEFCLDPDDVLAEIHTALEDDVNTTDRSGSPQDVTTTEPSEPDPQHHVPNAVIALFVIACSSAVAVALPAFGLVTQ